MHFATTAPSWREITAQFLLPGFFTYRGQSRPDWPIESTLVREVRRIRGGENVDIADRESWMLYQFQRLAHHHIPSPPPNENYLDWFSLIQHHGGPTRLIDFTRSLLVAAYFAIESADGDAAIWALRNEAFVLQSRNMFPKLQPKRIDELDRAFNARFNDMIANGHQQPLVLPVEPQQLHQRLWLQQGMFLAQMDLSKSFVENLTHTFTLWTDSKSKDPVPIDWQAITESIDFSGTDREIRIGLIKIVLPREIHREIRNELSAANISAATLFPGLDGLARSLKFRI